MQNAPLCKIGPGGDFTGNNVWTEPVSDDAKSCTVTLAFTYPTTAMSPEAFRLARMRARRRTRMVDAVGVATFLVAGAVASWVSLPGPAWLGVGLMLAGVYVWVRDRAKV